MAIPEDQLPQLIEGWSWRRDQDDDWAAENGEVEVHCSSYPAVVPGQPWSGGLTIAACQPDSLGQKSSAKAPAIVLACVAVANEIPLGDLQSGEAHFREIWNRCIDNLVTEAYRGNNSPDAIANTLSYWTSVLDGVEPMPVREKS